MQAYGPFPKVQPSHLAQRPFDELTQDDKLTRARHGSRGAETENLLIRAEAMAKANQYAAEPVGFLAGRE